MAAIGVRIAAVVEVRKFVAVVEVEVVAPLVAEVAAVGAVAAEGKGYTRHCFHSFARSAATCRLAVAVVAQASAAVSAEARRRSLVAVHTRVPVIV